MGPSIKHQERVTPRLVDQKYPALAWNSCNPDKGIGKADATETEVENYASLQQPVPGLRKMILKSKKIITTIIKDFDF